MTGDWRHSPAGRGRSGRGREAVLIGNASKGPSGPVWASACYRPEIERRCGRENTECHS